ncbi:MAG: hypothetical protein RL885_32450 [Planctomycetota bacterium]
MGFEKRDRRFHCTKRALKSARKAKHDVERRCAALKAVLTINPERGLPVKGFAVLRKMRVQVPEAKLGKRGGYRCIYRKAEIDEIDYVVFLEIYFKGDREDLTPQEYKLLEAETDGVLDDPLLVDWEDA